MGNDFLKDTEDIKKTTWQFTFSKWQTNGKVQQKGSAERMETDIKILSSFSQFTIRHMAKTERS